jgi:prepilin-type N-terminal cleavage/methylation domain-containing protein
MRRARRAIPTPARAFTLVEMLAVIAIIAIASAIMVPAFSNLVRSVNFSAAVNTVTTTLGSARSLAIQQKRHTAVLFMFDTETEAMTLQVLEEFQAGGTPQGASCRYFAFAPAAGRTPVELPAGVGIYGLPKVPGPSCSSNDPCPPDSAGRVDCGPIEPGFIPGWYENIYAGAATGTTSDDLPLWVFPHNDARLFMPNNPPTVRFTGVDPWAVLAGAADVPTSVTTSDAEAAIRAAQTYAIVFSPEGRVVEAPLSGTQPFDLMYLEFPDGPVDRGATQSDADYGVAYDWPDIFDPDEFGAGPLGGDVPRTDRSPNREVIFKTVEQLAIVDLADLADALGVARPWFIRPGDSGAPQPDWLDRRVYFQNDGPSAAHREASSWIDDNAEVLSFSRYSGEILRRTAQ